MFTTNVKCCQCKQYPKMRHKQAHPQPVRRKNRLYSPTALTSAYKCVLEGGTSVRRASILYKVPETTLRDRVNAHPDTLVAGKSPLFDQFEEAKLVEHFKTMASYGYGYSRQECVDIASDYAVVLGKRSKDNPLTLKWIRGFLSRWPEIRVLKPRSLEYVRAKMASESVVSEYFQNLKCTSENHDLHDKPHLIFNMDEKGMSIDYKPPHIVASSSYCLSAVTSGKGQIVTLLGCCSAAGQSVPPYFVFPGKCMRPELLTGSSPGAYGNVSESGWSNGAIFRDYLENHFLKYVPGRSNQKVLLIVDGHKSHLTVGLSQWALQRAIVLFILPAHCSHILQPLDVACYGPFQQIYNVQCHKLIRDSSSSISRYNVCGLACRVYTKALTPENVQSGFRRTGIFPFNADAVPKEYLLPADIYQDNSNDSQVTLEGGIPVGCDENNETMSVSMFEEKEKQLRKVKSEKQCKPRKTMSKIVAGRELTEDVVEKIKEHEMCQKKVKMSRRQPQQKSVKVKGKTQVKSVVTECSPQPGPSHINLAVDSDIDSTDSEVNDDDLCCVCNRFTPEEISRSTSIIFTKWAKCDGIKNDCACSHWVHLIYCTPVRVIRRGDTFLCPHCVTEE